MDAVLAFLVGWCVGFVLMMLAFALYDWCKDR
jgi:hypothetical protein